MSKDYVLQIKVKNGPMLRAMRDNGYTSALSLAKAARVNANVLGMYLGLKLSPLRKNGELRSCIQRIAGFLHCDPLDLFPEQHYRDTLKINRAEIEVSLAELPQLTTEHPDNRLDRLVAIGQLDRALEMLTHRECDVLKRRFGFDGKEQTFEEVGAAYNLSRERVRQIEAKALRKLKHPNRRHDISLAAYNV